MRKSMDLWRKKLARREDQRPGRRSSIEHDEYLLVGHQEVIEHREVAGVAGN